MNLLVAYELLMVRGAAMKLYVRYRDSLQVAILLVVLFCAGATSAALTVTVDSTVPVDLGSLVIGQTVTINSPQPGSIGSGCGHPGALLALPGGFAGFDTGRAIP